MAEKIVMDGSDEILVDVMGKHDIGVKQLAAKSRCGQSTIYKYREGALTAPMSVWAALYEMTHDMRILELITGQARVWVVDIPSDEPKCTRAMNSLISAAREALEVQKTVLKILDDGRVDRKDYRQIVMLKEQFPQMIRLFAQTVHTVNHLYEISTAAKAVLKT